MSSLAPTHVRERARHEHARLAFATVLDGCTKSGIDLLPVKGILTAHIFYRDPGERPIQDVDLRVRATDLSAVEQAGRREGWRRVARSWAYQTLAFDVLGFLVEFESHVGPPGLCGLPVDDMLRRAHRSTAPLGIAHLQPELHDHAVLLCVNAFKDKLVEAMPWAIRDLELLPVHPGFDPERFVRLVVGSHVATLSWIVANWLVEARRAIVWGDLRERLSQVLPRRRYARLFSRFIASRTPPRQALRVLARAGSDRFSEQMRALCVMAVEPMASSFAGRRPANVPHGRRTEPEREPAVTGADVRTPR